MHMIAEKEWLLLSGFGDLAPGDEFDVLGFQEVASFGAGEEVVVTLAPSGAPGGTLASGGF